MITKSLPLPWAETGKTAPHLEPIILQDSLPCPLRKKVKHDIKPPSIPPRYNSSLLLGNLFQYYIKFNGIPNGSKSIKTLSRQ